MKTDKEKLSQNIASVLVIQLAGLGDMVLATPAIHALKQLYLGATISLLTNERSAEITTGSSDIDEIFILRGIKNLLKICGFLRGGHYDIVINLARIYYLPGSLKMFLLFSSFITKNFRIRILIRGSYLREVHKIFYAVFD